MLLAKTPSGADVDAAALARLVGHLRHRGPDDEGTFREGACGLAHTRLSILDLSTRARQPMHSASGRYVVTYNGEIYNYRELRNELRAAGRAFRTDSDTEVILHLAETGGVRALERLEGMFAFGLYDRQRSELVLVRDRLGIKPLFYARNADGLAFASEPKALPRAGAARSPDAARIAEFLAFRHLAEDESLEPDVHTLPPGHRLLFDGRSLRTECWWKPSVSRDADPADTGEVVAESVQRQLVSDVPVGTFLSGGIDSALVTQEAARALPEVCTFTVGFAEEGWDETERARSVAARVGAKARELRLTPAEYVAGLGPAIFHLDAPLNHAHSVHLLALSRFARRHITVALTGEGSDELFGGYPRYRLFLLGRALRHLPGRLRTAGARRLAASRPRLARLLEAAHPDVATAAALNAAFAPLEDAAALAGLARADDAIEHRRALAEAARAEGRGEVETLLELERRTYLVSLLQRMDRMSMAAGLESRVPLLDERMVDHATSLASRFLVDWRDSKKPMRQLAAQRFGRAYAYAPKSGFGVPLDLWLRGETELAHMLARLLSDRRTRERGWIDVERAGRLFAEHRAGARDRTELLWGVLNLELWARVCWDGEGPETVTA